MRPLLVLTFLLVPASTAYAASPFTPRAICRAAIAAVMDRDPKFVQATDAPDGVVALTYARPFDNFVFAYRCRIEGDLVVWADEPGRWRDGAKDPKVSFEIVGDGAQLRIITRKAGGMATQQTFDQDVIR